MKTLELNEGAPPRPELLTHAEAEALDVAELAVVTRRPGESVWQVSAGGKVGVARVGDLQVIVRPKIAMDRLLFLMGYARRPTFWRDHSVLLDSESDLVDALAHSFARLATKALEQGLLNGYVTVEEALPVVRGRIRVADQIGRRYGRGLPVEVTYDDFTVDIAENRLLLAALLRLLRLPTLTQSVRKKLQRLRIQLADVTALRRGAQMPTWIPSRLNVRYQPALHLADLILAGDSFEQRVGDLTVSGFVFDMWKIYEDFVCVALTEALRPYGGRSILQHRMHLDESRHVVMKPDFYWHGHAGEIVLDAKYKAEKPAGFPQADLYQLLAYCTVLGVPSGHLVYAKGNEEEASYDVFRVGVTIHCHTLDLAQAPADLLAQIETLALRVLPSALQGR